MEPQILLEERSPNGNVEAIVEQDDRVAYLYLRGAPETGLGVRSCWVRNLRPAPPSLRLDEMNSGRGPMLPRDRCAHPEGAPALEQTEVRLVWFEEGDAVALLDSERVLAIIPGWSGRGVDGYAADCTAEGALCWPLLHGNVLLERVRQSETYWRAWEDGDAWRQMQESHVAALESQIAAYEKYFAIDGGEWPPRALVRLPASDAVSLVTIGVSLRAQPTVDRYTDDALPLRRIELAIALSADFDRRFFNRVASYISGQANLPWTRYTWLGHGHTLPCDAFDETSLSAILLVQYGLGVPAVRLPPFRGDPVHVLWAVPIHEDERRLATNAGSRELIQRLAQAGVTYVAEERGTVV